MFFRTLPTEILSEAEKGVVEAQYKASIGLHFGILGFIQDKFLALSYLRQAVEQKHVKAIEFFQETALPALIAEANNHCAQSQYTLAIIYYFSAFNLLQNNVIAFDYLKLAVEQHHVEASKFAHRIAIPALVVNAKNGAAEAQYLLSTVLHYGTFGIGQNKLAAFTYLKKAVDQHHPKAITFLREIAIPDLVKESNVSLKRKYIGSSSETSHDSKKLKM